MNLDRVINNLMYLAEMADNNPQQQGLNRGNLVNPRDNKSNLSSNENQNQQSQQKPVIMNPARQQQLQDKDKQKRPNNFQQANNTSSKFVSTAATMASNNRRPSI